ncbi:MAG TPA: glutathione S-transferase [Aurantimonas sp.]|jgi:glutathione S-transferase|nr:glutathione S-transferase [Aurantimonas sp.]
MRLFYAPASPFAAKVRMAASHCGLELDEVAVDTAAEPTELLAANPLGKIPTLVTDEGNPVFDSSVICDLFDRMSGNQLVPQPIDEWQAIKTFEATVDGVIDALLLTVYEVRYRPEDKRYDGWVDKQIRKGDRGLVLLDQRLDQLPTELTTAHFALAGLLGWMNLRFPGKAAGEFPRLAAWLDAFCEANPALAAFVPQG